MRRAMARRCERLDMTPILRVLARARRDYPLTIVLAILFVLSLVAAAVSGWMEYAANQHSHHQAAGLFGPDGYAWVLAEQITQNWQSEFLALATIIVLATYLIHRGAAQSKDGRDEIRQQIEQTQRRVDELVARRTAR
jgi:phosphotransferase system  glucose/maltose/N-acetylglucosamine-specific IIC component